MIQAQLSLIIVLFFVSLISADEKRLQMIHGIVIKIQDGDTLTILRRGQLIKVRLQGVDAPEKRQAGGMDAKKFASDLVLGKKVSVVVESRPDRYQRTLGTVLLFDGKNLNQELVKAGHAWFYAQYSKDETLAKLEKEAKAAKRGLWSMENPVPPWVYRRR